MDTFLRIIGYTAAVLVTSVVGLFVAGYVSFEFILPFLVEHF
jgi:hypothetical protein